MQRLGMSQLLRNELAMAATRCNYSRRDIHAFVGSVASVVTEVRRGNVEFSALVDDSDTTKYISGDWYKESKFFGSDPPRSRGVVHV